MENFANAGFYFVMGCCMFACGAMVIALVIAMFKDLIR